MRASRFIILLILVLLVLGALLVLTWDIPPPTETIERPISHERLNRQ